MLLGVQLTLLAVLALFWQAEIASVVLTALGTFLVVGGYRFG
jgi:uncharacterized membrane protein HdeD (DUF308 family)